jgi:hypothetical protein
VIRTHEDHLAHYGILRRSGRYPWGSGGTQNKRNRDFLDMAANLKKQGMTEKQIADGMGITIKELRGARTVALAQQRQTNILTAQRLKDKGWSNTAIGERMGHPESTIRGWLSPGAKDKASALETTANMLKEQVDKKKYVDVGKGVEHQLGITNSRLNNALAVLKEQGYPVHTIYVEQVNIRGKFTPMQVLARPGTKLAEVQQNRREIQQIQEQSIDHGRSYFSPQAPLSVGSRRIGVVYGKEGAKADGMIYVRPGVPDLAIGNNRYGQVRILVDGTHYLKGMAVYKEDLPPGKDLIFNTKAADTGRKKDAMKPISEDPDLPFGSIIRQVHDPKTGNVTSAMNLVGSPTKEGSGEEGQWDTWSRNLSSQFLSKQSPALAKQQLDLTYDRRKREFDEINALTNPTVRKDLLEKFADQTDAAAVHLKSAALPRQATKVLIPVPSMKPTEIYAPTFNDGDRVVLVRYPHGGTFEIPQLTVNNRNREARKLIGTGADSTRHDAVGIHHKVAQRLSGADFDGDTVLIIPNKSGKIESTAALEGLKGFDPMAYKLPKDSPIPRITNARKQNEMGKISNLITDMTLQGADTDKLSRAIRHSMVVIDSEKHGLDFAQSEKDHGILDLKEEYQGSKRAGAQTIISRKKSPIRIEERRLRSAARGGPIDPVTGKKVFEPTGRTYPERKRVKDPVTGKMTTVKTGVQIKRKEEHRKLAVVDDAFDVIPKERTPTSMEVLYATHSNKLKALANEARKETVTIKGTPYSKSAKKVYETEVASINAKLNRAEKNAPYERQAHLLANANVSQKKQVNPQIEAAEEKKIRQQELNTARVRTGAKKYKIDLTQEEWNAIQAGAITPSKLERVLNNSDSDTVKVLAMPKHTPTMTSSKVRRAQAMLNSGYTQAEVADALGVGLTTLKVSLTE